MTRREIQSTPIPTENGVMIEAHITTDAEHRWRTVWHHDGGRRLELFGEPYPDAGAAAHAAMAINQRGAWA